MFVEASFLGVLAATACVSRTRGSSESVPGGFPFFSGASGAVVRLPRPRGARFPHTASRRFGHVRRSWCLRCDRLCHGRPLRNSAEYHFRTASRESAPPRASSGASRKFSVARDKTLVSGVPPREKRSSPTHEQCVDDDLVQATFRRRSLKTHRTVQRQERQEHGQLPTTHQTCIPNQASNMNMSNVGDWTRHMCCERKDSVRICVRATSVLSRRQSKLTCQLVCLISSTAKRREAPKDVVQKQQSADLTQLHQSQTNNFLGADPVSAKISSQMVYKSRTCYPRTSTLLRQNSDAPQQRAHPQQRDMRISSSRPLSDRTPLSAVRDLLQGIDKILAHGHTHATCLDVRVRPSSVSNTAVMHSSKALPGLTHGEEASSIFSDPSGLHTASSHSAPHKSTTIRSAKRPMCNISHKTVRPPIKRARGLGKYPTRQNTIPRGPLSWPQIFN